MGVYRVALVFRHLVLFALVVRLINKVLCKRELSADGFEKSSEECPVEAIVPHPTPSQPVQIPPIWESRGKDSRRPGALRKSDATALIEVLYSTEALAARHS